MARKILEESIDFWAKDYIFTLHKSGTIKWMPTYIAHLPSNVQYFYWPQWMKKIFAFGTRYGFITIKTSATKSIASRGYRNKNQTSLNYRNFLRIGKNVGFDVIKLSVNQIHSLMSSLDPLP